MCNKKPVCLIQIAVQNIDIITTIDAAQKSTADQYTLSYLGKYSQRLRMRHFVELIAAQ